ncbi:serine/threonine-protein kinase [Tamaricihabitans halophyticus]|nr:serine/threonine-protein kinase [Tamaricihabitans halophyticus]
MATQQSTQPVQRVIAGRYGLVGEIGRGGMGVVWRAEDRVIGRQVAIKELRVQGTDSADEVAVFTERVLREVRTGGRLNDPAVVTVYDVISEGGATYIVMELVAAPTLADLVRDHGPMPAEQVAAIGEQVLSALQAAHQSGVVHRDVKPGNVLVLPNGRVKLTDFGIAQAVDDPRLTTSGMLVGSPAFMAPERIDGAEATPAADLWALGATLFFAVEGTVAFERSSTAATLHAIMHEVPYLTRCGGPLASVITGLLITAPDARLTADQARGLLQLAANQQATPPAGAPPQTAMYQAAPGNPQTMLATGPNGAPRRRTRKPLIITGAIVGVALLVAGGFLGNWLFGPSVPSAMQETMTFGDGGQIEVFDADIDYAACFTNQLQEGREYGDSNSTDCEELHDIEVIGGATVIGGPTRTEIADSSDGAELRSPNYPGIDELTDYAQSYCTMLFDSNQVDWPDKANTLSYYPLVPSQQEWDQKFSTDEESGSNSVYCVVAQQDGSQFEGSVRRPTS